MSAAEHDDARWAELAAGYALHALEPAEEEAFTTHLAGCAVCRATLDDHELVAAQLASLADDAESAAPPWSRIRPVLGPPSEATPVQELRPPGNEAPVRRLHPRHTRLLAAAAAFAALVAVGVTGWQLAGRSGSGSTPPAAVAKCRAASDCHVVALLAGKAEAGDVLVRSTTATVVPTAMPTLDRSHVYVLWQLPRDGRPTPVTVLRDVQTDHAGSPASLAIPYDDTAAFAMSVENADAVPSRPTKVVALGTAS